ncbi:hypothetical protein [Spiroplasma sp. DGKH1]|uniref:hypothetical protein n=1 Tax=Spiroplasma sp. DGKH1 TaxID=3050074 RepID=UPI0034C60ACD
MRKEVTTNSLVTTENALVCKYCQNNIENIKVFLRTRVFPNLWNEELFLLPITAAIKFCQQQPSAINIAIINCHFKQYYLIYSESKEKNQHHNVKFNPQVLQKVNNLNHPNHNVQMNLAKTNIPSAKFNSALQIQPNLIKTVVKTKKKFKTPLILGMVFLLIVGISLGAWQGIKLFTNSTGSGENKPVVPFINPRDLGNLSKDLTGDYQNYYINIDDTSEKSLRSAIKQVIHYDNSLLDPNLISLIDHPLTTLQTTDVLTPWETNNIAIDITVPAQPGLLWKGKATINLTVHNSGQKIKTFDKAIVNVNQINNHQYVLTSDDIIYDANNDWEQVLALSSQVRQMDADEINGSQVLYGFTKDNNIFFIGENKKVISSIFDISGTALTKTIKKVLMIPFTDPTTLRYQKIFFLILTTDGFLYQLFFDERDDTFHVGKKINSFTILPEIINDIYYNPLANRIDVYYQTTYVSFPIKLDLDIEHDAMIGRNRIIDDFKFAKIFYKNGMEFKVVKSAFSNLVDGLIIRDNKVEHDFKFTPDYADILNIIIDNATSDKIKYVLVRNYDATLKKYNIELIKPGDGISPGNLWVDFEVVLEDLTNNFFEDTNGDLYVFGKQKQGLTPLYSSKNDWQQPIAYFNEEFLNHQVQFAKVSPDNFYLYTKNSVYKF